MNGDREGPELPEQGNGKEEEGGNRNVENAVMLGFFVVLVALGIWLLGTMADVARRRIVPPRGAAIV